MTFFVSQEMNCFWARFLGGNPLREIPIHWTKNICRCFCTFAENLGKFLRFRAAFLRLILRSCLDSTRSFWAAQPCLFWRIGYLSFPWCWEKCCLSYRGIWSDSPKLVEGYTANQSVPWRYTWICWAEARAQCCNQNPVPLARKIPEGSLVSLH